MLYVIKKFIIKRYNYFIIFVTEIIVRRREYVQCFIYSFTDQILLYLTIGAYMYYQCEHIYNINIYNTIKII